MVAAQWGETRDTDARTGGGVSGRFRLLGDAGAGAGSGDAPDTTPPPFGTAPWGYRRSEVDAWASWVAGLVAHGRNETVRADSAEATLRATLERLDQLERPGGSAAPSSAADVGGPLPTRHADADADADAAESVPPTSDAGPAETIAPPGDAPPTGDEGRATPVAGDPDATAAPPAAPPGARTSGRLHFEAPADLPRRTARRTANPDPADASPPADPPGPAVGTGTTAGTGTTTGAGTTAGAGSADNDGTTDDNGTAPPTPDAAAGDHDLARLHVVETTLHEVLELLHHLADRK